MIKRNIFIEKATGGVDSMDCDFAHHFISVIELI